MIRSIALIHLFLVLHSQMARLSNRRRRQPKHLPDMLRLLDHSPDALPVPKRGKDVTLPRQPQGQLGNTRPLPSGAEGRITLRLTRRPYDGPGHEQKVWWTAPRMLLDPHGARGQDDIIVKEKDREDWLRRLRPRPPRRPAPPRREPCRRGKIA